MSKTKLTGKALGEFILQEGPLSKEEIGQQHERFATQYSYEMVDYVLDKGEQALKDNREELRRGYLSELAGKEVTLV